MKVTLAVLCLGLLVTLPAHAEWRVEGLDGALPSETYLTMVGTSDTPGAIVLGCKVRGDLLLSYRTPSQDLAAGQKIELIVQAGDKDTYIFQSEVSAVDAGLAAIDFRAKGPLVEFLKDVRDSLDYVTIGYRSGASAPVEQLVVSARGSTRSANMLLDQCDL